MTDPMQAALEYAARGWAVMPCHHMRLDENFDRACSCGRADCGSPGKHPRPRRGVHDATTSDEQIVGWWRHTLPGSNVAVATGAASGIYVVDLDGADAIAEWDAMEMLYGATATLAAITGGGGRHLYFALPPRVRLPNTAKRIGAHIDTRGDGGYVLAPPSNHRSGRAYRWENWPAMPAPMPGWLNRLLSRSAAPPRPRPPAPIRRAQRDDPAGVRILTEEAQKVAATQPGGRNEQLFRSAASVFSLVMGGDIRMEAAWAAMEEAGLACGLKQHEVSRTINSAIDAAKDTPRRIRTRQIGGAA